MRAQAGKIRAVSEMTPIEMGRRAHILPPREWLRSSRGPTTASRPASLQRATHPPSASSLEQTHMRAAPHSQHRQPPNVTRPAHDRRVRLPREQRQIAHKRLRMNDALQDRQGIERRLGVPRPEGRDLFAPSRSPATLLVLLLLLDHRRGISLRPGLARPRSAHVRRAQPLPRLFIEPAGTDIRVGRLHEPEGREEVVRAQAPGDFGLGGDEEQCRGGVGGVARLVGLEGRIPGGDQAAVRCDIGGFQRRRQVSDGSAWQTFVSRLKVHRQIAAGIQKQSQSRTREEARKEELLTKNW